MARISMPQEYSWSYYPQQILKHKKLRELWKPKGYVLLAEAIELLGKEKYVNEWSGLELYARLLPTLSEIEFFSILGAKESPFVSKAPKPLGSGYKEISADGFTKNAYLVATCCGSRCVKTKDEAEKLWAIEAPKLQVAYDKELCERERFEAIVDIVRTELYDGVSTAYTVNKSTGKLYEIPKEIWGRERIADVFEMGNIYSKWASPNIIQFYVIEHGVVTNVEGSVLLKRDEVLSMIKPNEQNRNSTIAAEVRCGSELLTLMQNGKPQKAKTEYFKEMKNKHGVSERAFNRAWGKAITDSRNADWGKKGRPKNGALK